MKSIFKMLGLLAIIAASVAAFSCDSAFTTPCGESLGHSRKEYEDASTDDLADLLANPAVASDVETTRTIIGVLNDRKGEIANLSDSSKLKVLQGISGAQISLVQIADVSSKFLDRDKEKDKEGDSDMQSLLVDFMDKISTIDNDVLLSCLGSGDDVNQDFAESSPTIDIVFGSIVVMANAIPKNSTDEYREALGASLKMLNEELLQNEEADFDVDETCEKVVNSAKEKYEKIADKNAVDKKSMKIALKSIYYNAKKNDIKDLDDVSFDKLIG